MNQTQQPLTNKSIVIDEEGYPIIDEKKVTKPEIAQDILENITIAENGAFQTVLNDEVHLIEAFDEPLVARNFKPWTIQTPFELDFEIKQGSLTVDEWDRFHGLTTGGIPFVLSRQAQAQLFDLCDDYDDDSITINKNKIQILPWMASPTEIEQEKYWSQIYRTETPRWELNQATPALLDLLPRLKLPKSRILVLGCGSGNDAAEFAKAGHLVTAVDISPEALALAKSKYGDLKNLTFVQSDVFQLGHEYTQSFDLVFEHTCFCAIPPNKRNDLINVWNRCLTDQGQLLAVLFVMEKRNTPPFGGTEWEYRERLKKQFHFLFWGRVQNSIDKRQGKELLILAKKKRR